MRDTTDSFFIPPPEPGLQTLFADAQICFQAHDDTTCLHLLRQLLVYHPTHIGAWKLCGLAELRRGHYAAVVQAYQRALHLNEHDIECLNHCAFAHHALGQEEDALACYERLLAINPEYLPALQSLGTLYIQHHQYDEAIYYLEKAVALNPHIPELMSTLAHVYCQTQQWGKALVLLEPLCACGEGLPTDYGHLGEIYQNQGKINDAARIYNKGLEKFPDALPLSQSLWFLIEALPTWSKAQKFDYYCSLYRHVTAPSPLLSFVGHSTQPAKKLKIGYMSGDFKLHSVMHDFLYLFHHGDREQFEIFIYADNPMNPLAEQFILPFIDHWYEIEGQAHDVVCQLVQQHQIDILVNISASRLPVFARKPAPIQIAGLGLGNTTGLTTVDYFVADPHLLPESEAVYFTEKPYYLSSRMHWYYRTGDLLTVQRTEPPCVSHGFITFGSGNNSFKMNESVIACWAEILKQLPESRLALKFPTFEQDIVCESFRCAFQEHGILPERLSFKGKSSMVEHLQFYNTVDVVLDPFPYQGGVSTLEALWMGCPVVTLNQGIRTGTSILQALGHPAWIAQTLPQYVDIALQLAQQPQALSQLKQTLSVEMQQSPLCDGVTYTREMENLYRQAWQTWCNQASDSS